MAPHLIIKKYFARKQKVNPKYSLRSFARDLDVNPGFVSRLLNGKQEIPLQRLDQIAKILEMDSLTSKELKKSMAATLLKDMGLDPSEIGKSKVGSILQFDDRAMTAKEMSVLSPWYNITILELVTCANFKMEAGWIAKRLNLTNEQVERSLSYLTENGYLQKDEEGQVTKTNKQLRLPTKLSVGIIRQFHKNMMEFAVKEMFQKTGDKDFTERLITSTSIAVNKENIPKAKERMLEMQIEIAEILRAGECTEVFDLTLALFPLTQR